MPPNFDKAVEKAVADRRASDSAGIAAQRDWAKSMELARAITDAYLSDLSPRVVQQLRRLGIAPKELSRTSVGGLLRREKRVSIRWWSFGLDTGYDDKCHSSRLSLLENGTFVRKAPFGLTSKRYWDGVIPEPVRPPLYRLDQVLAVLDSRGGFSSGCPENEGGSRRLAYCGFDDSYIFADPDSRRLYIVPGTVWFRSGDGKQTWVTGPVHELSAYVAWCIGRMVPSQVAT